MLVLMFVLVLVLALVLVWCGLATCADMDDVGGWRLLGLDPIGLSVLPG